MQYELEYLVLNDNYTLESICKALVNTSYVSDVSILKVVLIICLA